MKRSIATIRTLAFIMSAVLFMIIGFPLASQALVKCTQPSDCSSNGLTCMSGICDKCVTSNDCNGAVTGPHCLETGQCGPGPGGGGETAGATDTCKSTSDCQDGQRCPTEKSSTDIFCVSVQIGTNCTVNGDKDCGKGQTCTGGACAAPATPSAPSAPATVPFSAINPTLMIPIPTIDLGAMVATQAKNGDISIPYIAVYIAGFYKFGVAAAAVLAVIMIMVSGFRWLAAAGNAGTIGEAKRSITSAVIGLILAVGSYTALQVINPDLLNLKSIVIKGVATNGLSLPSGDQGSDTSTSACADESSLVNISDTPNVTAAAPDNRLTSDTKGALAQAGAIAVTTADPGNPPNSPPSGSNFSGLKVFSAYRSQAYQQQLFSQAVAQYGSPDAASKHVASGATCQGAHLTGHAVDIHLMLGGSELGSGDMSQARIDALESIMNQAGWVRYCPEWWHFEFNLPMGAKRAKPCDKPYGSGNSAF